MTMHDAEQVLSKFDEILKLCGADDELLLTGAIAKFTDEVRKEVFSSKEIVSKDDEEKEKIASRVTAQMTEQAIMLVGVSVGGALKSTQKTFVAMASDKEALRKASDELLRAMAESK